MAEWPQLQGRGEAEALANDQLAAMTGLGTSTGPQIANERQAAQDLGRTSVARVARECCPEGRAAVSLSAEETCPERSHRKAELRDGDGLDPITSLVCLRLVLDFSAV